MLLAPGVTTPSYAPGSGVARGGQVGAAAPGATIRGRQIDITKKEKKTDRPTDNFGKMICKCM